MPIVTPTNTEVLSLRGLHLYHYALSNCSQKARMTLEEKGQRWTSHHLDLSRNEHVTPEYIGINPNGVVPTLVHDGKVVVESSDIIDYLDVTFPTPPLKPSDPAELARMESWIELWDAIQAALKTLSHEFLFKVRKGNARRELARYERIHKNEHLIGFLREFTSPAGLSPQRICGAHAEATAALARLNRRLSEREWLAGDAFSLADLAWSVNLHRFNLMRFPMHDLHGLRRWFAAVAGRPSFQRAVVGFEPTSIRIFFRLYALTRELAGSGPRSQRWQGR
ncbi:glutathione S-transferase family protein [Oleomonas cavernae]|uniref:Glutathione S-transferase family protein n=1 Tax=Oleomonas cavernae TaxID=2320859 RepID=A0A418VUF1_9PROT|nr:glutathione S-transferase family protein [Oleomonas cavernae]RJF80776.1 glutathione S-transferase family protein [Oleomonas cavernae]